MPKKEKLSPSEEAVARAAAEAEILALLVDHARARTTTGYKELAGRVKSIEFWALDSKMLRILDSLAASEDDAGRGMLSVLVVSKQSGLPGAGFFILAAARGRNVEDQQACFEQERDRVWAAWEGK